MNKALFRITSDELARVFKFPEGTEVLHVEYDHKTQTLVVTVGYSDVPSCNEGSYLMTVRTGSVWGWWSSG